MTDHRLNLFDVASMAQWIQRDGVGNIIAGMVNFLEEDFKNGRASIRFRAWHPTPPSVLLS